MEKSYQKKLSKLNINPVFEFDKENNEYEIFYTINYNDYELLDFKYLPSQSKFLNNYNNFKFLMLKKDKNFEKFFIGFHKSKNFLLAVNEENFKFDFYIKNLKQYQRIFDDIKFYFEFFKKSLKLDIKFEDVFIKNKFINQEFNISFGINFFYKNHWFELTYKSLYFIDYILAYELLNKEIIQKFNLIHKLIIKKYYSYFKKNNIYIFKRILNEYKLRRLIYNRNLFK